MKIVVPVGKDTYVALDKLYEKQRWLRDRERGVVPKQLVGSKPEGEQTVQTYATPVRQN